VIVGFRFITRTPLIGIRPDKQLKPHPENGVTFLENPGVTSSVKFYDTPYSFTKGSMNGKNGNKDITGSGITGTYLTGLD
jgi:hypothetical protein